MVPRNKRPLAGMLAAAALLTAIPSMADAASFSITGAEWRADRARLEVKGKRPADLAVTIYNAYDPRQRIGADTRLDREEWKVTASRPSPNPCRVLAVSANGQRLEMNVKGAPSTCAPKAPTTTNQPPVANAGPDQTRTLAAGQSSIAVTLNGGGSSDPDGTIATYNWTGAPDPANSASPTVNLAAGSYTFSLVVTDNSGASSAADTVQVTVNPAPPVNQPPTANAGPDQTLTLAAGQGSMAVTLSGSGSSDPDGTIATYTWSGTPNPADVVSPTVNLAAGSYTFSLVVTDNSGASSAADTVQVIVNPAPNQAPTANAGPDQTLTLAAGQSSIAVTLNGSGSSDPDGTIATYSWTGTPDPANSASPTVTLAAGTFTFSLVVTDNNGASSAADTVTVRVNPAPNQAPTANAGPDQTLTLTAGQSSVAVTLNGSGSSDSDGTIATYNWTGTPDPANSASPTVTLAAGTFTFSLVVTDNNGASSAADTVTIRVNPAPNQAPTANAGPDQTLSLAAGQSSIAVTLNGSGSSDPDGTIATYNWTGTPDPANTASPTVTLAAGTHTFTLAVTDNSGATSAADTVRITVNAAPNQVPTANAGPDQTLTLAAGQSSMAVTLNGGGSSDADGTITTYTWSGTPNPTDVVSPTVNLAAGSYTFSLVVTDNSGASSAADTVQVIVNPAPNQAPTANAGPDQTLALTAGQSSIAVTLNGSGSSDPDGTIAAYNWTGTPDPANSVSPTVTLAAGTYTFSLVVTDNNGATSASDTVAITVNAAPPQACKDAVPSDPAVAHAECITEYTGPEVCVACHETQARDMHGSVHYQQGGAFPNVPNIPLDFYAAGERPAHPAGTSVATGVNTYCGTHENSPRFTCAGCHVGNGRFPMAQSEFELLAPESAAAHAQLANIDCLMCHQEVYKRFPDWTTKGYGFTPLTLVNVAEDPGTGKLVHSDGSTVVRDGFAGIPNVHPETEDFQFLPAGSDNLPLDVPMAPMAVTTLEAARTVHPTTRQSCLNCHAGAAGADGAKRGDLSKQLAANASATLDYHMSPQGADQTCSDCHNAGDHRVRGRGLDLRANDVPQRFTCESSGCHTSQPHPTTTTGTQLNRHTAKVACQTCHIPKYAKAAVGTEVARDWQDPHPSDSACNGRGGWLPREDKGFNLTPSYTWFDGKSEVYYLGEPLNGVPTIPLAANVASSFGFAAGEPAYVLGVPTAILNASGAIDPKLGAKNATAKIYPMKEHWGKLASDGNTLIGHSTFEFFRTGSFCRAVAIGDNQDPDDACPQGTPGPEMPSGTDAVAVHTFQTINHGVEPKANALGANGTCGTCHDVPITGFTTGKPLRMKLELEMGYAVTRAGITAGSNGNFSCSVSGCHGSKTGNFTSIHSRSQHRNAGCTACHANR